MKCKICDHCGQRFEPSRRSQKYCTETDCRRSRKRQWQKEKLKADLDYKAAQREAQTRWRARNPDYHRHYRKSHPDYTQRNRILQRVRNKKRTKQLHSLQKIAKMDTKLPVTTGLYHLFPIEKDGNLIAKMESKVVQLTLLQYVT